MTSQLDLAAKLHTLRIWRNFELFAKNWKEDGKSQIRSPKSKNLSASSRLFDKIKDDLGDDHEGTFSD